MMEKTLDLIGLANPMQDLLVDIDRLPVSNQNMRLKEYCFQGGGNVTTALAAAGMLGLKTSCIGVVGDDIFGYANIEDFKFNHVDTSRIVIDPGTRTDFCIAVTESSCEGKNFLSISGTCRQLAPEDLDEKYIQSAKVLHLGGLITPAAIRAAEMMHAGGGKVSIDANYYRSDVYDHYNHYDIFIASETYYKGIVADKGLDGADRESVLRYIRSQGPEIVLFTFGSEGGFGLDGDEYFEWPIFRVKTVDSTGAGDVFHGAFVYCHLQGWDVKTSARFCAAVSAIKCTRQGGRAGIPTLENVLHFLNTGEMDTDELDKREFHYRHGFFGGRG